MKSSELMIGDWVHMKAHRGFESQNIKVETIPDASSDNHYGHIGAYPISEDMDFRDIEDSHLEPIPLTPEILEKNGFTEDGHSSFSLQIHDGSIRFSKHQYGLYCNILRPYQKYDGVCNYVHNFQQALRLCGIDKEIEL